MHRSLAVLALALAPLTAQAQDPDPSNWDAVLDAADGQTVYFHAWGGSQVINDYIQWAGDEVADRFGVTLELVRLADTADAVSRVISERAAGRDDDGAVDLIWINGENFVEMKDRGLLFGPWAEAVPNWQYVDVEGKPAVVTDFTEPTEGFEAPWSIAQLVFIYDSQRVDEPPTSADALLDWVEANPGRFTFPQPPNYMGSTFLKQILLSVTEDDAVLYEPADQADYDAVSEPLWEYMETLTPNLWRSGDAYPQAAPRQIQLMADNEIDIALALDPATASAAIADNRLQPSARTFIFDDGTIGNASFLAIPYNSGSKAAAMVVANFLMSPEAQLRKQDPDVWGAFTVLDISALPQDIQDGFDGLDLGPATIPPEALGPVLEEPHATWMTRLEEGWEERFGTGQ